MPTAGALGSLLLLALLGTALAQLILFRVSRLFGARRLSLVTYLLPGFALVYGALILDERVDGSALIGLALILLGVALGSGALRLRRRAPWRQTTPTASHGRVRRGSDQDAECGLRRTAAPDELCRLVEVDAAVECEHEGGVAVEADGDQLLDPPAEHAGGRVGRRSPRRASVSTAWSVGSPLMPLSTHVTGSGSAPPRTAPWRTRTLRRGPARGPLVRSGTTRSTS